MDKIAVNVKNENDICTITLSDITGNANNLSKCIEITKHFACGNELFFGHYRTDGISLTQNEWIKYGKEIPEYFRKNGRYEPLTGMVQEKRRVKQLQGYLTIGSLPMADKTFEILPWIFHYYLETICFCPEIDWKTYSKSFQAFIKHGAREYVSNGFAEFLFSYCDSGEFSISFNRTQHDQDAVLQSIQKILFIP